MEDPTQSRSEPDTNGLGTSGGGGGRAKYKLMSPAKLPISRSQTQKQQQQQQQQASTCLLLSPSSFLESPVLLFNVKSGFSNMVKPGFLNMRQVWGEINNKLERHVWFKAEPSPTTGSFFNPQVIHGAFVSNSYNASTVSCKTSGVRKSSCLECGPPATSNMIQADVTHRRSEQTAQVHSNCVPQSFILSPKVRDEMAASSNEPSPSTPSQTVALRSDAPAEVETDGLILTGTSNGGLQASHFDNKGGNGSPMLSDDGYNWRKYGQKLVKGSEFPRSYYKCTHPNCEVKKLFERSHEGQITEIIYKGTHDHPKPQPNRRYGAGAVFPVQEGSDNVSSFPIRDRTDKSSCMRGQMSQNIDPSGTPEHAPTAANDDIMEGVDEDDDPFSKRRKMEAGGFDVIPVVKPIREPRVVVQTLSEVDILDDGYRWRKYGQKVVRGNPNPRSYYKCTNLGCPVRKHVERASHDPKAVITTYEGKHNHDVPAARTSSHDTAGPTALNGPHRTRSDEKESISLDLGVGIGSSVENRSNDPQQELHSRLVQGQAQTSGSSFRVAQAHPLAAYYGVVNSGMNQYGSRQNPGDANVEMMHLNHSSYPQNLGRLVTGP